MADAMQRQNVLLTALEACQRRLRAFISRRTRSTAEAEDIFQEISYRQLKADSYLDPIEHVSAWLFRAARNELVDRSRKQHDISLTEMATESWPEGDELADILFSPPDSTEDAYLYQLVWEELAAALQREAFEKTELQVYSFKQLAQETGVPVETLLLRKHQSVQFLRVRLQWLYQAVTQA
ncbi:MULTISPECIES: RNA polymerase sigma factor [Symbiopectobacterium]|uniref:RNA polymerase sigma factor n=1 Tax=Symbiopectobacterium TaxID=801 RepID=UPI001A27C77D|nr:MULTISPECIES: RNA polymerase sigma factor [Symbiopectobacterium]MBG6249180.1 RNA polymerase sigma factor [Candidatus Symbiopectobacterium sp. PLON1]MBT9430488.1 RNA polymerase sigma factor [Candidatus Symbiopectobacterium endolongispinus]